MTPIEIFQLFTSIKLHFTTDKYDYFKYNGKTSKVIDQDSFEKRKDKYHYYKLIREYNDKNDLIDLFVSNFLYEDKVWIGDMLDDNAKLNMVRYRNEIKSISDVFNKDCEYLSKLYPNPKEMISCNGDYPLLLNDFLRNEISFISLCILNNVVKFADIWNSKIIDDIIWPILYLKIVKFTPFIQVDILEINDIMTNHFKRGK